MDKLLIRGGNALQGEVLISGAKNAALPELCAALLTDQSVTLANVPHLQDVVTMLKLIRNMGVTADRQEDGSVLLNAGTLTNPEAPYELVKTMRASVLALGPLLARFGHAKVSLPGGCAIGSRPVDQHIKGLQAMGAVIDVEHGYMLARLKDGRSRLHGARIATDMVTVTGTENFLMAATLAEGETILENAAQEPEIPDLAEMLIAMGAKIEGHGTSRIRIQGVEKLHGCNHRVVADRIEAGTFLCAVAATGGDVFLRYARGDHLDSVIDKLRDGLGDVTRPALFAMVVSVVGMSTGTLVQRSRGKDMPLITGTAAQYVSSGAVLLIASSLFETWEFHLTGEMILALLWSVLVLSLSAVMLMMLLISRHSAARVSSLFFLTPALSAIESAILFGERLGPLALVALVVALTGVWLTMRNPATPATPQELIAD